MKIKNFTKEQVHSVFDAFAQDGEIA